MAILVAACSWGQRRPNLFLICARNLRIIKTREAN
jgi:hypothetical protein